MDIGLGLNDHHLQKLQWAFELDFVQACEIVRVGLEEWLGELEPDAVDRGVDASENLQDAAPPRTIATLSSSRFMLALPIREPDAARRGTRALRKGRASPGHQP